jgi:hypothetical protein
MTELKDIILEEAPTPKEEYHGKSYIKETIIPKQRHTKPNFI